MKRFLLFFWDVYYPEGGMNDFISDHDTMKDAEDAFEQKVESEIEYRNTSNPKTYSIGREELMETKGAHIYDTEKREIVWRYSNSVVTLS